MKNMRNLLKKATIMTMAMMMAATPQAASACCENCCGNYYGNCGGYFSSTGCPTYNYMDRSSDYFTADSYSYVVSDSGSRYLTQQELDNYSGLYLMLARNEIYAKHGYIFNDQNIQRYFDYKDWYYGYVPSKNFSANVFNEYERYNIDMIVAEENSRGGAVKTLRWDN